MHVYPCFSVSPQINHFDFGDETINSGDMATASCAVTKGDFPLNITWVFNDLPLNVVHGVTISRVNKRISTLSIESARAEDSGKYTCLAENAAGKSEYSSLLNVNGILLSRLFFL